MKLTNIERLHQDAVEKIKAQSDGGGKGGLSSLIDTARYFAIVDICTALRKDFAELEAQGGE